MEDPRHEKRIKIVQNLFASTFPSAQNNTPHPKESVSQEILEKKEEIDAFIQKYAPKYPLDRIAKTDLAILRLAVYELIIKPDQPKKVVIDEAVKLAKEFGGDKSYAFVNAVLGTLIRTESK